MADLTDSHCWAPDEAQVFKVVKIRDREGDQIMVSDIDPKSGLPRVDIYPVLQNLTHQIFAIEELHCPPGDLIQLTDVHRAGILHALRHRFEKDLIYTSVGPILVALNPFKWIKGIYDDAVKQKYADGDLNLSENPHVFAMAHDAHQGLQLGKNQSLIISGESGAGKTEATKQCLSYLATAAGSSSGLQNKILQASPILEAWGNAKTLRNNNSSRFGKFIEIWFGANFEIAGSSNTTYLLEKSRVVFQESGERNYHIFYQLLFGAPDNIRKEMLLEDMAENSTSVNYINQSGCIQIEGVNEVEEYSEVTNAMTAMGFDENEEKMLLRAISGILHLGNLDFIVDPNNSEACQFSESGVHYHAVASQLFGLDPHFFRSALLYKAVKSGKRASVVYSNYSPEIAAENRNALSKELYNRCFNWIVGKINAVLNVSGGPSSGGMIGILDIFGFEIFKKNSFEQLCINLANEALQQHFNVNIFQHEMEIYESEGIVIPDLSYNDNQDVLDLIMKKPKGLIPMLDEEGQVPRGSTDGFINKFTKAQTSSPRLKYRMGQKEITIVHYAGEVKYDPALFLTKNKDTLSQDLIDIFGTSSVELFSELFKEVDPIAPPPPITSPGTPANHSGRTSTGGGGGGASSNKLTVGYRFRVQLDSLICNLNTTEPRYIRCIKPNQVKKPDVFEAYLTNEQLTYSGVFEAVVIMQNGYPFRLTHADFLSRYHMLALKCAKWKSVFVSTEIKLRCSALISIVSENLNETIENCHVGKTMVFYRSEQHRYLEKERKKAMDHAPSVLQRNIRGSMVRHLVVGIRSSSASCEKFIDAADMNGLLVAKDELKEYCEIFEAVCSISLYESLRSLSERYYAVAELQKTVEKSLEALLSQKGDFEDGLLTLFDAIEEEFEKARTIDFNETFNGRDIVIMWSDNGVFLEAEDELDKLRIIKNVKSNLDLGIKKKDEILLKEWVQKLVEYRTSGQVTGDFCGKEEKEAIDVIEEAQKQYADFIGSTYAAIREGKFHFDMSEREESTAEQEAEIIIRVDAKPIHSFVEKNKKRAYASTSMQIKQTLMLCESLHGLRSLASNKTAADIEWVKLWELLQPWKTYFSRAEDENGQSLGRSESIFRQESSVRAEGRSLYRSASMVRSNSMVIPGSLRRMSSMENSGSAQENVVIPWLPDLSVEISEEIQSMVKCCLEAVYFRQLAVEVKSNHIPLVLAFENIRLPLSAMDHTLKVLGNYSHIFSMNQVNRYSDAKERWQLRRGVCGRSAEVLTSALSVAGGKTRLAANDPELLAAQQFCHLYTCEKELMEALIEDKAPGHAGHMQFSDVQFQRLSNTLTTAERIVIKEKAATRGSALRIKGGSVSGWKVLLDSCIQINSIRKALQSDDLDAAIAQIDSLLEKDPWRSVLVSLQSVDVIEAESARNTGIFVDAINAALLHAPSVVVPVDLAQLHHDSSIMHEVDPFDEAAGGDCQLVAEPSDSSPDLLAVELVTKEAMRYRAEIKHLHQVRKLRDVLTLGALVGDVGELDTSAVSELKLEAELHSAATSNNLIPTADSVSLLKCAAGVVKMRAMARIMDWDSVLSYIDELFLPPPSSSSTRAEGSSRRSLAQSSASDSDSVEKTQAYFERVFKKLHPWCQAEYKVFFSEVIDLQTRNKLLDAFSTGCVTVNEETGDLNCFFASVDKLAEAINFADLRSEKSIECQYLYTSAKLLFCLRFQVMANRWENMHVSSEFPASMLLNFPTENVMVELRDELLVLKNGMGGSEVFRIANRNRVTNLLATLDYFVSSEQYADGDTKAKLFDPVKVDLLLQNPLDFLKKYLGNTVSSSRRKSMAASRQSIETGSRKGSVVPGSIAPNLAVADLLVYGSYYGFHESVADEIDCISNAFRERNCRVSLVLAASVDCVKGTVDTLDSTSIEIDLLAKCVECSRFYLQTRAASPLMHAFYSAAFQLLNIRLAVDGSAEGVDLLTYFSAEQLDNALQLLDEVEFPQQEIRLVVDHIRDSNSIAALTDAIHLGRPQFYMGKFDTKNVGFEHLLTYLEIAKRLVKRSDRLDRLMFYAELCVLLRKALINHQWDISELGERSNEPKSRGISVKQCLDDYAQAGNFFQRRMVGIPPRALIDEFEMAQREWDRRMILQGFPTALQSGQLASVPGSVELREIKYARLQQQIERAEAWLSETGVKDPDLDMLVRAAYEIVETRKALIAVHMLYRRSFDPVVRSRSETIQNMNINRNVTDGARSLEKIVKSFTFLDDAIQSAVERVSKTLQLPYTMVTEWREVESCVAKMEVSGRLRSTKLQVELLAAETFERSFAAGVLEIFHSLESTGTYPSMAAKNNVVVKNLLGLCKAHVVRGSEMAKMGNLSLRFSNTLEILYSSAVILMNLYIAESSHCYEKLSRDWKAAKYLAQLGTAVTPGIHLLEQNIFHNNQYSVQAVLRTTMVIRNALHPCVAKQVSRASRHVEDEITLLELSLALKEGAITGRVGGIATETISVHDLEIALHRAHETSYSDVSNPNLLLGLVHSANSGNHEFAWRAPCRLKYSPKFSITEVAIIDMTVGWGSGLASQMFTEKWGSTKRQALADAVAKAKSTPTAKGAKKSKWGVLKAHLKAGNIVPQYKYMEEDVIKAALENSALSSLCLIHVRRPDVIQLRNSCEMICELRRSMKVKDYEAAFEILNENLGRPGYSFSDMFRVIYEAEFSIHPLAMEEFTLIALEVCESYWRVLAREALSNGITTGSRGRINITDVSWKKLDEVLELLDGLLEISRESIILRELCYMVRYMRRISIRGGEGGLRSQCRDGKIVGIQDPKNKRAPLRDLTEEDAIGAVFIEDAAFNAITMVQAISMKTDLPEEAMSVKQASISLTASTRVSECLGVIDEGNLPPLLRSALNGECSLLQEHNRMLLAGYALEKTFSMEGLWFSYTSSTLELSPEVHRLLESSVEEAKKLKFDASFSAEARWALMLAAAIDILAVMDGCAPVPEEAQTTQSVFGTRKPVDQTPVRRRALESLRRLIQYYQHCDLLITPTVLKKYDAALTSILNEDDRVNSLLALISGAREATPADGFDAADIGEVLKVGDAAPDSDHIISPGDITGDMASFKGSVIWRIAMLHVKLRRALAAEEWSIVKALSDAIIAADMFNVRSDDVTKAMTMCRCLTIQRHLQQGITACILPPFPGWSAFSNYRAIICNISDYSLRQAVEECEKYINSELQAQKTNSKTKCKTTTSIDKASSSIFFNEFPMIPELLRFGSTLIDLVSALRGSRWTSYARGNAVVTQRRSSLGNANAGNVVLQSSQSLYLQDGTVLMENNETNSVSETSGPAVSLEEITQNLDEELLNEVNSFREHRSVEEALSALKELLNTSVLIDSSYGVGKFLEYTISTVATELQFIGLDDRVKLAIEECSITGVPGKLVVPPKSFSHLKAFCAALIGDESASSSSSGMKESALMLRCSRLRRGYLSGKLLLHALNLISNDDAANDCDKECEVEGPQWAGLYRILKLYRYMASLEWTDPEKECETLMISPDVYTVSEGLSSTDGGDPLRVTDAEFIRMVDERTQILQDAALTSMSTGSVKEEVFKDGYYVEGNSHSLKSTACEVLQTDVQDLLRVTEEVAPFMQLLDQHCAFKVAEDMFKNELHLHLAVGLPGELDTDGIDPKPLQVVMQIIFDSGLIMDGMPGQSLYNAAKALSSLRISQKNAGALKGDPASDDRSCKFTDMLHSALENAEAVLKAERDSNILAGEDESSGYLARAATEIETARLDIQQRDFAKRAFGAITAHRIILDGEENNLANGESVVSKIIAPVDVTDLAASISECNKFGIDNLCPVVMDLYSAVCKLNEIRVTVMMRSWTDVVELFKQDPELVTKKNDGEEDVAYWKMSFRHELTSAHRLAVVSLAVEACDYAVMVGSVPARPLGGVYASRLNCTVVTRALDALSKVPNDWRYETIRCYIFTMEAIQLVRRYASDGDWNAVHDVAVMTLHKERLILKPLLPAGKEEVQAALEQSKYYLSEYHLLTALGSQWRMKGDVGSSDGSCISATVLKHAVEKVESLEGGDNDYIQSLLTSTRIIYDLRRAQLYGLWVSPENELASYNVSVIEESVLDICFPAPPALSRTGSEDGCTREENHGQPVSTISKNFLSLVFQNIDCAVDRQPALPEIPALVQWLMKHSNIDQDFIPPSADDEILSVEEVLQGAEFVDSVIGLAEQVQEELDFAREELCYRIVTITLLRALCTPGCNGGPGALEVLSPDFPVEEGVPSIAHAIEVAERNPEICSRAHCKWLLRDAKLLYRLRSSRRDRDWIGVREVLLEALDQNDIEALNDFHVPRMSMLAVGDSEIRERSNALVHQPIMTPVWTEILIIRADFNFYACLADFAQEISNGIRRPESDVDPKDKRHLTAILQIVLRTRAAALMWPNSPEFDRLLETEEAALELRAQRIFDSGHFPSTNVITRVEQIRRRDAEAGLISYGDLLMPEIELLSDMLNIQQLIDSMENALNVGQGYLRCPIGHISRQEMELDLLGDAVKACLLQKLDSNGSSEQIKLVKLGNVIYNIRTNAADGKWDRVLEVMQINSHILRGRVSIAEELARLNIEAQNFEACSILRTALSSDRFTNVLDLVKRISKHKMQKQSQLDGLSAISASQSSFDSDVAGIEIPFASRSVNGTFPKFPSGDDLQKPSVRSSVSRRTSFVENSWKSFSEELVSPSGEGHDSNRVDKLENAINLAMSVHHKSDITSSLLKAAVLIRSLRTAISAGYWDEVQQIISEESNYRNTKVPAETLEEIRVAKAALHYRNCMIALSKGLIVGRATGSPGNMNLSSIECIMLQSAISQAEVLEIDADPGALAMLDIARCVCSLRQAIMAARWFAKNDQMPVMTPRTASMRDMTSPPSMSRASLESPSKIGASFDLSTLEDTDDEITVPILTDVGNRRSESVISMASDDELILGSPGGAQSATFGLRKHTSVEEAIVILKGKLANLPDDWEDDSGTDGGVSRGRKESLADATPEETLAGDNSLDWIALQARAVRSAKHEVNLLDENLKERRRQEYIVGALEAIPPAVQIFRTGASSTASRVAQGARGLDGMSYPNSDSRSTPTSAKDMYLAKPLERALAAARDIPGVISEDTAKLIRTAELILSFRQAMNDLEIENFKKLIESARVLTEKQLISGHYGVFELSTYRSATMTVSLSKAELMKAIRSGTVRGHVHAPFYDAIEVEPLHYWVEAHEASAKDMTIALKHALVEARILTGLRRKCKQRDWNEVKKIIEEEAEEIRNVQYSKDEIEFIVLACRYQLDVAALVEEISTAHMPKSHEEQFSYVSVRMSDMRRGGRTADAVLDYITEKNLVDSKALEKLKNKNSVSTRPVVTVDAAPEEFDDVMASDASNKTLQEGHYQLAVECYAIKRLLKLWSSISAKNWQMEPIAAGMVHAFANPHDPFLATFMNSLRQHEVVQRLANVHNQLQSLKLRGDKKVKNIKHTVRASVAFVLRTRVSGVENIVGRVDPIPPTPAVLRTLKQRSQHFFTVPQPKGGVVTPAVIRFKAPESKPKYRSNSNIIMNRKISFSDAKPVAMTTDDIKTEAELTTFSSASASIDDGDDIGHTSSYPRAIQAPLLRAKAARRLSIGEVAQEMNMVSSEQALMDRLRLSNNVPGFDVSKAKRRISIGSVGEEMRGRGSNVDLDDNSGRSVANVLCSEDWTTDPEFSTIQFDTARNTLIDQVVQMRLMWGCMEGSVEEDADGNILTEPINTDLLTVALSDVRKVEFYTHKGRSEFSFSKHTLSIIRCANGILHCREAAAAEKYEDLMYELRRLKYVVDQHSARRMDMPELCPTASSEAEFDRFVRLACQQHSLSQFSDAINLLWTRTTVDMALLRHSVVLPLGERYITGISPTSHVTPMHALILLLGMAVKNALVAAHNGNTERVHYEQDICVSLLSDPQWDKGQTIDLNFEGLISIFKMLGGYDLPVPSDDTASMRVPVRSAPRIPSPLKAKSNKFFFHHSDEPLPESETREDLNKVKGIFYALMVRVKGVSYNQPLLVLSDHIDELKFLVRRLESTLSSVTSGSLIDPWVVLASNLILMCSRPAYDTDETGQYLHKLPYAVCEFIRDSCGGGRGARLSDIDAGAYVNYGQSPTPLPGFDKFSMSFDVTNVTSFLRILIANEAENAKVAWAPDAKNLPPVFKTDKVKELTAATTATMSSSSAGGFVFAGEGSSKFEISSVTEAQKCVTKVRFIFLSNARLLANALQISESNSAGLAKVALLDAADASDRSKAALKKEAMKERLYSRFGRQCEFILRSVEDAHTTCSGDIFATRSKQLRTAIYKRRRQLKN